MPTENAKNNKRLKKTVYLHLFKYFYTVRCLIYQSAYNYYIVFMVFHGNDFMTLRY